MYIYFYAANKDWKNLYTCWAKQKSQKKSSVRLLHMIPVGKYACVTVPAL